MSCFICIGEHREKGKEDSKWPPAAMCLLGRTCPHQTHGKLLTARGGTPDLPHLCPRTGLKLSNLLGAQKKFQRSSAELERKENQILKNTLWILLPVFDYSSGGKISTIASCSASTMVTWGHGLTVAILSTLSYMWLCCSDSNYTNKTLHSGLQKIIIMWILFLFLCVVILFL